MTFTTKGDELRLKKLEVLGLSGNNFNNSIFSTLTSLPNLKSLYISYNRLEGPIHIKDISGLSNLEELYISSNQVNDFVASQENERLMKLRVVDLDGNLFNNSILAFLNRVPNLKSLTLGGYELQGSVDLTKSNALTYLEDLSLYCGAFSDGAIGISNNCSLALEASLFPALKRLRLHGFSFEEGTIMISQGICELGNLKELDLSMNNLKGSLPECFSNLTSLESLDLSDNQLSGNISVFGSLASLQVLSLSNNHFQIPMSLGPLFNLSKLKSIFAENNIISAETQMHSLGAPAFQLQVIRLSCCGDVGAFPEFLYYQHQLLNLDLSNIYFKGNQFPYWLLENNTELWFLDLTNTSLSGPLQLPKMRLWYLDISRNFFNGSIPVEFGEQLPSLQYLNMSKNHFSGSIPSSFGDMTYLDTLDLSNNQLSGGIPEHLTMSCPSLRVLALSNNKLEGKVFSGNSYLPELFELKLDGNNFYGKIPDVLSRSPSLKTLDVSNNQLSGEIPSFMGNISSLEEIIMSNNHLQGTIPAQFCQLESLRNLDLSVNNISGTLPSCSSSSWQMITELHLSKNRLRGTLPSALRNSTTLMTLDISHNFFTGIIPSWIGGISTMSYLLLSNNLFHGEIPMELCLLYHLSLINLSHNNLSGRIPPCLRFTTLEDGQIPEDFVADGPTYMTDPSSISLNEPIDFPIKNVSNSYRGKPLTMVSGIDLSCNKLVGEIPYEFGNFSKIIVLNLSHNSLTGPIPPSFANLQKIESIDLSYNKLSGSIPRQLVVLNFLAYFVVSFNNLSGKTPPRSAQFGTFDESSYRGNPFLCGEPLPKCTDTGPSPPMPNSSTDDDEDDGLMDMEVFHVSFSVSYVVLLLTVAVVLYINPYWRRAWFYHVETTATCCYYFVLDNILPRRYHC